MPDKHCFLCSTGIGETLQQCLSGVPVVGETALAVCVDYVDCAIDVVDVIDVVKHIEMY